MSGRPKPPAIRLLALGLCVVLLLAAASGQFGRRSDGMSIFHVQGTSTATRILVEESAWARQAEEALRTWRATLFGRMATQYKELERKQSNNGSLLVGRVEPHQLSRYDLFNPFINCTSGPLVRLGSDKDGGKFVCLDEYLTRPGCIVYSLGSNGQYDFEEAILEATKCEVHTFDCTYAGTSLPGGRHTYHKTCVGQPTSSFAKGNPEMFRTYDAIMADLNHTRVDLLKIDVEAYEYDIFAQVKPSCGLPRQIAIEVHYSRLYAGDLNPRNFNNLFWSLHELSLGELAVFFGHFADLGYAVVSRDDNIEWGLHCCAEFTLLKVEKPAVC